MYKMHFYVIHMTVIIHSFSFSITYIAIWIFIIRRSPVIIPICIFFIFITTWWCSHITTRCFNFFICIIFEHFHFYLIRITVFIHSFCLVKTIIHICSFIFRPSPDIIQICIFFFITTRWSFYKTSFIIFF